MGEKLEEKLSVNARTWGGSAGFKTGIFTGGALGLVVGGPVGAAAGAKLGAIARTALGVAFGPKIHEASKRNAEEYKERQAANDSYKPDGGMP